MSKDYIPGRINNFNAFQKNYVEIVTKNAENWKIEEAAIKSVSDSQKEWDAVYPKASNMKNRTSADVTARQKCQKDYVKAIRTFTNQQLMYNPLVSDADRRRLGLNVHSDTRTPTPVPVTAPVVTIGMSERQQHTIHFVDEAQSGRGKPQGVHACEIWMKKGSVPTEDAEMRFVATVTKTPHVVYFDAADTGIVVHYKLRWVNTRGQSGPWSAMISGVIG